MFARRWKWRAIGLVALVTLAAATAAAAGPGFTFLGRDATGDSGAAPDIVTGSVQQADSLATTLLFRVELGNRTTLGADDAVVFGIDSDTNDATGPAGKDYALMLLPGSVARLARYGGGGFELMPSASLQALDRFGVSVARSELGNPERFDVSFLTIGPGEETDSTGDIPVFILFPACANKEDDDKDGMIDAVDTGCAGAEDENEADERVTLRAGRVTIAPKLREGVAVVATVLVTTAETGKPIAAGTARCTVRRVGGAAIRALASLSTGRATCRFTVPRAMKGHSLRGSITVVYRDQRVVVPFRGTVA